MLPPCPPESVPVLWYGRTPAHLPSHPISTAGYPRERDTAKALSYSPGRCLNWEDSSKAIPWPGDNPYWWFLFSLFQPRLTGGQKLPLTTHISVQALDGQPVGVGSIIHVSSPVQLTVGFTHTKTLLLLVLQPTIPLPSVTSSSNSINPQSPGRRETSSPGLLHLSHSLPLTALCIHIHWESCHFPDSRDPQRIWWSEPGIEQGPSHISPSQVLGLSKTPAIDGLKDGGLHPCIDYCGLNAVTMSYSYPLFLVPSAIEQLRGAHFMS